MTRICTILAFVLCTFAGYAQFGTGPSVRLALGEQTTNNKYLIVLGNGAPSFTPAADSNAYVYIDTTASLLYQYSGGAWNDILADFSDSENNTTTNYLPYWDGDSWEDSFLKHNTSYTLLDVGSNKNFAFFESGGYATISAVNDAETQNLSLRLQADTINFHTNGGKFIWSSTSDAELMRLDLDGSLFLSNVTTDNTNTDLLALDPVSGEVELVTSADNLDLGITTDFIPYWDGDSWEDSFLKHNTSYTLLDVGSNKNFAFFESGGYATISAVNDAETQNLSLRLQADTINFHTNGGKFIWSSTSDAELMRLDLDGSLFLSNVTTDNTNTDLLALDPVSGEVELVTSADNLDLGITTDFIPYWDGDSWEDSPIVRNSTSSVRFSLPASDLYIEEFFAGVVDISSRTNSIRMGALDGATINGPAFQLFSNSHGVYPGQLYFDAGNNANSNINFRYGSGGSMNTLMVLEQNKSTLYNSIFAPDIADGSSHDQIITRNSVTGEMGYNTLLSWNNTTTNYLPYWDGDSWEDSPFLKDGSFFRYDQGTETAFYIGDNASTATNNKRGFQYTAWSDGNLYFDHKTYSAGEVIYRYGHGAEVGSTSTFAKLYPDEDAYELFTTLRLGDVTTDNTAQDVLTIDATSGEIESQGPEFILKNGFDESSTTTTIENEDYLIFQDSTIGGTYRIQKRDLISEVVSGTRQIVGLNDADYTVSFSENNQEFLITAQISNSKGSDIDIDIPTPSSALTGKIIKVWVVDNSSSYKVNISPATGSTIRHEGSTKIGDLNEDGVDKYFELVCMPLGSTPDYYWMSTAQQ